MDIRSILTKTQPDTDIEKIFTSATCRKKDLGKLTEQCKCKLLIYQQIMRQKQSLMKQYQDIKDKFQNLSQGLFSSLQKQYEEEKCHTQLQNDQKIESASKRSHNDRNNIHFNGHQAHTKHIKKVDKRRK